MIKKVTGVSIGLVLVIAAIPWLVGRAVEDDFIVRLERLAGGADALLQMRLVQYERGWLASVAVHRVMLGDSGTFDIVHRFDHLPRVGEGWARVRSVPVWRGHADDVVRHYFGSSAPVTVDTVIGFDGTLLMSLRSPAFGKALVEEPDVRLTWGGAEGWMQVAADGRARVQVNVPGLAMHGQGVVATFADLRLDGDWRTARDPMSWAGRTLLRVSAIGLSGPDGGARLRHVETELERHDEGDSVSLAARLQVGEGVPVGDGANEALRNAVLELRLDQLGKPALRTYLERMAHLPTGLPPGQQTHASAHMALALLADLLEGAPRLRIEQLRLTTPNGSFSAAGVLAIEPDSSAAPDGDLFSRLRLDARVDISQRLLEGWLARDMRPGVEAALLERRGEVDARLARELTERFARERIDAWTAAGILAAERDRYQVRVKLAEGQFSLNGVPSERLLPSGSGKAAPGAQPGPARHGSEAATVSAVSGEMAADRQSRP